jgi:histidinol-phosphate aminotransferase
MAGAALIPSEAAALTRFLTDVDGDGISSSAAVDRPLSPDNQVLLNQNVNAYGPSPMAIAELRANYASVLRFPKQEAGGLTESLATVHKVKTEQVVLGCGSREVMRMATRAYLAPGKKLITALPTFKAMSKFADEIPVETITVPITRRSEHDLESMLAKVDASTGLIYICNPNNPTGTITPRKDIEEFLNKLPRNVTVLIDEAYHGYPSTSDQYVSFIDKPVDDDRVIVTRSFSKIYGLAGLRVGYGVAAAGAAKKISAFAIPQGVNVLAARAAKAALTDSAYVKDSADRNMSERQELMNQVNARMLRAIDSVANFVMVNSGRNADEVIDHLKKHNVLVGPFFPSLPKYIRVSMGTSAQMATFWRAFDMQPGHPMPMPM